MVGCRTAMVYQGSPLAPAVSSLAGWDLFIFGFYLETGWTWNVLLCIVGYKATLVFALMQLVCLSSWFRSWWTVSLHVLLFFELVFSCTWSWWSTSSDSNTWIVLSFCDDFSLSEVADTLELKDMLLVTVLLWCHLKYFLIFRSG